MSDTYKNLKWISLIVLVGQTSALVLLLRFSKTQNDKPMYLSSTAVLMSEIIKFFTCLLILFRNSSGNWNYFKEDIYLKNIKHYKDVLKVSVPAICYVLQNNLLFLSLSKLDAATYQVTYQLKILTTAFFAVSMLKKKLIFLQWIALFMLTAGVALVQFPNNENELESRKLQNDKWIGLTAIIIACFLSGFSGIFIEKILKETPVSLWMRNTQLAFFSIFGAFLMVWLYDYEKIYQDGFFQGYNPVVWTIILLQAYGGLLISLVVKYADNILKGFAVSLSILLSSYISWQFLNDFDPNITFFIGSFIVILSTVIYGLDVKKT